MPDIAYQNKDITSKILGEKLKNKSFSVYGVKVPKIIRVLPTNLPAIQANELRIDNLFLLEDGSLALVDYESDYKHEDKIKYLDYIARTIKRCMEEEDAQIAYPLKIRMIVIYLYWMARQSPLSDMVVRVMLMHSTLRSQVVMSLSVFMKAADPGRELKSRDLKYIQQLRLQRRLISS